MLRTEQQNKTFEEIIPSLTDIEKKYLYACLAKENLPINAIVSKSGGIFVLAALNDQLSLAAKLLEAGSPVYEKVLRQSFLSYAAERGADNTVSLLIQYGANRFLADEEEKALRLAVSQNRKTTVELLLKHYPYDPIKDKFILIDCAKFNDVFFLNKFLHLAPHSEEDLITALKGAIQLESQNTIQLLLDNMSKESILKANVDLLACKDKIANLLTNKLGLPKIESSSKLKITYSLKDIEDVDAIYLLYQLAEKSAIGQQQRLKGIYLTANVEGLYEPLSKDEAADRLRFVKINHKGEKIEIKSLGYFQDMGIIIPYGENTIDITKYLENFKIPYLEVISELDKLTTPKSFSEKNKPNSNDNVSSPIVTTAKNDTKDNAQLISVISEKLSLLFNTRCRLMVMSDYYITDLPDQPFELLKKYVEMFEEANLKIKFCPANSCCGGLVKIAAKLEFYDSLPAILVGVNHVVDVASNMVDKLISNMKLK